MTTSTLRLSGRDLEGLAFIGRGYEVAQYQLHASVFAGRAPTVVSRFVKRWTARKLIAVERLNRTGVNRLRLTPAGRDFLVSSGVRSTDLFAPRRPTALKDLAHLLWINDLRVAAARLSPVPDVALPAWTLQRRLGKRVPVVPDFLCIWQPDGIRGGVLACEVDLGGESIRGVFQPKLERLRLQLAEWAADAPALGIVFTVSERRALAINECVRQAEPPILVTTLPCSAEAEGRFTALHDFLRRNTTSFFQKPLLGGSDEVAAFSKT